MRTKALNVLLCGALMAGLSACTESRLRLNPDFGQAMHENLAAQTADPDAHYAGTPTPGSNGMRAGAAQERYNKDAVKAPVAPSTSTVSAGGGGGGGGGPQ